MSPSPTLTVQTSWAIRLSLVLTQPQALSREGDGTHRKPQVSEDNTWILSEGNSSPPPTHPGRQGLQNVLRKTSESPFTLLG